MTESPFAKALSRLATKVAEKASDDDTPIQERVDALKALTPYLALLLKHKSADKGDEQPSFLDFQKSFEQIKEQHEVLNGAAAVPGRPRRRN